MQPHSIELAEKILALLEGEDFHESIDALKITKVLLPSHSGQRSREVPQAPEECHVTA
jgi:hypothetical protein